MRTAYADATRKIFLIAGVIALVTLVAVALMPVTELRTTIRKIEEPSGEDARASSSEAGPEPPASWKGQVGSVDLPDRHARSCLTASAPICQTR